MMMIGEDEDELWMKFIYLFMFIHLFIHILLLAPLSSIYTGLILRRSGMNMGDKS